MYVKKLTTANKQTYPTEIMIYIETSRLILRDWKESDIEPFAALNADVRVMEYFLKSLNIDESLDFYQRIQKEIADCGYGLFAIEKKDTKEFIGFTGFHHVAFDIEDVSDVEIGWRIRYEDWNKGYVTEAGKACLEYAKENQLFSEVCSFTSVLNKRSERVMQKIGMEKVCNFDHPNVPNGHLLKEHVLYKISLHR